MSNGPVFPWQDPRPQAKQKLEAQRTTQQRQASPPKAKQPYESIPVYTDKFRATNYDKIQAVDLNFPFWGSPVYQLADKSLFCPGFVGPTYLTNPWDYIVINGVQLKNTTSKIPPALQKTPGRVEVVPGKAREFDKKKAPGRDGSRLTMHGLDLAEVSIKILIWTPEQFKILQQLWRELFPLQQKTVTKTKTKSGNEVFKTTERTPSVYSVSHPALDMHGINYLTFVAGTGPEDGPIARSKVFTIRAVEYFQVGTVNTTKTLTAEEPMGNLLLKSEGQEMPGASGKGGEP